MRLEFQDILIIPVFLFFGWYGDYLLIAAMSLVIFYIPVCAFRWHADRNKEAEKKRLEAAKKRLGDAIELAQRFESGEENPHDWTDAPEAVPLQRVTLLFDVTGMKILREFARREDVEVGTLLERWVDDRIRVEHGKLKEKIANASN